MTLVVYSSNYLIFRLLVSFYSSTLGNILSSGSDNDIPGVSIPASSNSIVNLLKVLATGIAISTNKADLTDVSKTAEAMGIDMENWQIGIKNKGAKVIQSDEQTKLKAKPPKKTKGKKTSEVSVKEEPVESSEDNAGKKHSCSDCGKQFGRKDHLNRHALTHSAISFPCDACGSTFKRKDGLRFHMSKVHDTDLVEDEMYEAPTNVKVEQDVMESNEDDENLSLNVDDNSANDDVQNETVDSILSEDEATANDAMIGEDVNGVENQDEKSFMEDGESHNQEDESKYNCNQCEKTFKNRTHLRRHETSHSGIKFSCSECSSTFSRKDKLNAHMRKKHSQSTGGEVNEEVPVTEETDVDIDESGNILKFECPYCQQRVEDLAEHCLENHRNNDEITEEA